MFKGEAIYAAPSKKTNSGGGTLGRRSRRGHTSALSTSSTASDRSENAFPDEHSRIHLNNGEYRPDQYYSTKNSEHCLFNKTNASSTTTQDKNRTSLY